MIRTFQTETVGVSLFTSSPLPQYLMKFSTHITMNIAPTVSQLQKARLAKAMEAQLKVLM